MNFVLTENKKRQIASPIYFKHIGLSLQLFAIIGSGTYFGWWLDQKNQMKFPIWLIVCCFSAVFVAFYHLWVGLKNDR